MNAGKETAKKNEIVAGIASWYSESDPGVKKYTASGKRFDSNQMWAASWDYPFGTRLKITNVHNGRCIIVTVEDRGPAKRLNRKIDLTKAAFRKLDYVGKGLIHVTIERIDDING
jgi:rare lipoprotein A